MALPLPALKAKSALMRLLCAAELRLRNLSDPPSCKTRLELNQREAAEQREAGVDHFEDFNTSVDSYPEILRTPVAG